MRWVFVCVVMLGCWSNSKSSTSTTNAAGGGDGSAAASDTDTATATATTTTAPLPAGCKRMRQAYVSRCSGVPPGPREPNSSATTVCDECLAASDCTAQPGGQCEQRGDNMCSGARRAVCLYPDPACGGGICAERVIPPPPSAPPSSR
ncbi:MAG TPA: hypothetical protein VMZ53_15580 [Kofleriaceae bacterium]|nr:hypothetical protein [Kofleriaceae bacterium]